MALENLSTQALAADVDQALIATLHFPARRDRRVVLTNASHTSNIDGAMLQQLGAAAAAERIVSEASIAGRRPARLPTVDVLAKALAGLLEDTGDEDGSSASVAQAMTASFNGMGEQACGCMDPAAELTPYLCLGGRAAAKHLPHLQKLGVTHVLNVADNVECFFPEVLEYLHVKIIDGGYDDRIVDVFEQGATFVRSASTAGGRVFVHCYAGINRSGTVAMAILMLIEGWTLKEAYDHIYPLRWISPFEGNREKLARWELASRAACSLPEWLPLTERQRLPESSTPAWAESFPVLTPS